MPNKILTSKEFDAQCEKVWNDVMTRNGLNPKDIRQPLREWKGKKIQIVAIRFEASLNGKRGTGKTPQEAVKKLIAALQNKFPRHGKNRQNKP
jgi:hypothetical protein